MYLILRDLDEALEMGMDWSLREGYAWAEDKEHCEEFGRMLQADSNKISLRAKKRGLPQVLKMKLWRLFLSVVIFLVYFFSTLAYTFFS